VPHRKPVAHTVPDEWDDEEDEEEEDNAKVWEEANHKAPMPELIISASSTGQSVISPPPAAFQPAMRILKRPSNSPSSSTSTINTPTSQTSLAEREAQYQEARERIFGLGSPEGESRGGDKAKEKRDKAEKIVSVVREPLGPSDNSGSSSTPEKNGLAKGFGARRKEKPRSSPPISQS
ncbi:hypothetical protein BJ138DRAFT_1014861, partial [Hygrophoropsis aurantiaca]